MLNEVKHLANVSCQVTARDPSDATLCQDDTQRWCHADKAKRRGIPRWNLA